MTRVRLVAPVALLAGSAVLLTGHLRGWRYSDDVAPGHGATTREGGIDVSRLATLYENRLISPRELHLLQRRGLAQAGVVSGPLACQGVTLQFDTEAAADAHMSRHPELAKGAVPCTGVPLHPALQGTASR